MNIGMIGYFAIKVPYIMMCHFLCARDVEMISFFSEMDMCESFQDYARIQDFEADFLWKVSLKILNWTDFYSFSDLISDYLKTIDKINNIL